MFNFLKKKQLNEYGTGCHIDSLDLRDRSYDEVVAGTAPLTEKEWQDGYDVEEELDFELPIKDQNRSSSCVGQAWAYYTGVLNLAEIKIYKEVSAKAFYSQIAFPGGGSYIREGAKLAVNWGALVENAVPSYENHKPPSEEFMRDLSWKNEKTDKMAKVLQAKEYRVINNKDNMDLFAMAIRDNFGLVGGLYVGNSASWRTNEPNPTIREGGHGLYYGKFGMDELGKYIASPNSWGWRGDDKLHPDGWQKLRQDYFNNLYQFNPWTLLDQPNQEVEIIDLEIQRILTKYEKKAIMESEGVGRKGIIVGGKLREITNEREAAASIYAIVNSGNGATISTNLYNKLPKGGIF